MQAAAGDKHSLFLINNKVFQSGLLQTGTNWTPLPLQLPLCSVLSASQEHSACLSLTGELYVWSYKRAITRVNESIRFAQLAVGNITLLTDLSGHLMLYQHEVVQYVKEFPGVVKKGGLASGSFFGLAVGAELHHG